VLATISQSKPKLNYAFQQKKEMVNDSQYRKLETDSMKAERLPIPTCPEDSS
jgi:hypothetical protein